VSANTKPTPIVFTVMLCVFLCEQTRRVSIVEADWLGKPGPQI
jgi:hypothetical protein